MLKIKSKKHIYLFAYVFGLFGICILGVNGQSEDCSIFQSAVNYLGKNKENFTSNDCCNLAGVVTCKENHITEL